MTLFSPAVKEATRARVALAGPSGSGKTYTALRLAHELGEKVAVVDTNRRRARQYAGTNGWSFNVFEPQSFKPYTLADILTDAAEEDHDVVIVDTLSAYWSGVDGHLEQVDRHTRGGWNEERPNERLLMEALMTYPGHVIVTLRTKTEVVVDRDENDHAVGRRVGLKPEQRDGIEYEFDLWADLDLAHTMTVTSTRIPALSREVFPSGHTSQLTEPLIEWLNAGDPVLDARGLRDVALAADTTAAVRDAGVEMDRLHLRNAVVVHDGTRTTLRDLLALRHEQLRVAEATAQRQDTPA